MAVLVLRNLVEIVTLRDEDGLTEVCSIFLKGYGPMANPLGPGPFVVVRLREHLDQAIAFQQEGIKHAGRADIHILAPSFARIFGLPSKRAILSPIQEEGPAASPSASVGGTASATAPLALPAPAHPVERK